MVKLGGCSDLYCPSHRSRRKEAYNEQTRGNRTCENLGSSLRPPDERAARRRSRISRRGPRTKMRPSPRTGAIVALIHTVNGRAIAVVVDRQAGSEQAPRGVLAEPEHFQITWCHWATNTRLLCGLRGMVRDRRWCTASRGLVAVDADGKNMRVLLQNSREAQGTIPGPDHQLDARAAQYRSDRSR